MDTVWSNGLWREKRRWALYRGAEERGDIGTLTPWFLRSAVNHWYGTSLRGTGLAHRSAVQETGTNETICLNRHFPTMVLSGALEHGATKKRWALFRGAEERGVGGTLLFWFHISAVYREHFRIRERARARERIREEFVYVYVNEYEHGVEPGVSSLPGNISQQGVIGFLSPTIRNPSQGSHQTDIS